MKIVPVDHDLDLAVSQLPRSPGLHISDVYNSLYQKLEPKRFTGDTPDPLRLELGLALEQILEEGLKHRLAERPGEFITTLAGRPVAYSPDLFLFNHLFRIGEIKLTYMSNRQGITHPKFDKWFTQMKAYCHATETPYARLYACFVNGDYRPPFQPSLKAWDIEFTKRELMDEWMMLAQHVKEFK